jgi:hypothetical protein
MYSRPISITVESRRTRPSSREVFFVQAIHGFKKPVTVTARDTPVAKDGNCLADLLKAQDLKGIEYRKRMSELVQYGCVQMVPANWMVTVSSRSQIACVTGERIVFGI